MEIGKDWWQNRSTDWQFERLTKVRKVAVTICFFGALLSAVMGFRMLAPGSASAALYRAHDEMERIAFSEHGSDALRKGVTDERLAIKSLSTSRGIARLFIACSALFSVATILVVRFLPDGKSPDGKELSQSSQTTGRGSAPTRV